MQATALQESVIVSLYPVAVSIKRRSFPGSPFTVKACKEPGKPQILVIGPQLERYREMMDRPAERPWTSQLVAADVQQEMVNGLLGSDRANGANPAIWVSPGAQLITPDNRGKLGDGHIIGAEFLLNGTMLKGQWHIPQAEIDQAWESQLLVLNNVIRMARGLAGSKEHNDRVALTSMRAVLDKAAEWLHISGEAFQSDLSPQKLISCPKCESAVSASAAECKFCKHILNEARWAELDARDRRLRNPQGDAIPQDKPFGAPIPVAPPVKQPQHASK